MIRLVTSFLSEKDIINTSKSKTPVVFLGGMCSDNAWREEIKKEFGDGLYLLDPYDKNYDRDTNTYKELAGITNSDYVIFYKGGEQSEQEKKFLDLIGRRKNLIKEFDSIDKLKKFLSDIRKSKLESIGSKVKKCAMSLMKEAVPFIPSNKSMYRAVDLKLEKLDNESIYRLVQDILSGETIKIPNFEGNEHSFTTFNKKDVPDPEHDLAFLNNYNDLSRINRAFSNRHPDSISYHYNSDTHTYEDLRMEPAFAKEAKEGVTYEYSCTKVDIPEDLAKSIMDWGKDNVKDNDLYTEGDNSKGREDQIHITLLYGIKDQEPDTTAKVISKEKPFEIRLGLINLFRDKKEYDVLKIEVESGDLEKLHYSMRDKIDNENTYPTYNPHVTIAYVKKDSANAFVGDETFKGKTFKVDHIVFSDGKDLEKKLPLSK